MGRERQREREKHCEKEVTEGKMLITGLLAGGHIANSCKLQSSAMLTDLTWLEN